MFHRIHLWRLLVLGFCFLGDFWSELVIGLFIISISSWFSLGRLNLSKNLSISSRLSILLPFVVHHSLLSVNQFSRSLVSDSLRPHELPQARPPCPSPTPGVHSNSCPSSRWCHPTISSCRPLLLPPILPSIRVFSNESTLRVRWPEYWSCSFSIIPSKEHPGLISFRMDWLHLLAVQGTLTSLLQHSVQNHQFFGAQPSLWSNSHIYTWLLEKPNLWLGYA